MISHCASNLIVIISIDEIRNIKKKRPDRQTIVKFACKEYGLSQEDTLNSLQLLVESKSIYVKTKRGKESFFVDMLHDETGFPSENEESNTTGKASNLSQKPSVSREQGTEKAGNGKTRKITMKRECLN